MRHLSMAFCLIILSLSVFSQQKKRLSHDDYAMWKQIASPTISPDGTWLLYEVNPQDGDGVLVIRNLETGQEEMVARAQNAAVSPGGKYAVFRIKPEKAVERQAKADKKKRDEMPVDSLGIYLFESGQLIKYPSLESFDLPKESSDWLTYVIDQARLEKEAEGEKEAEEGEGSTEQEEETTEVSEAEEEEDDEKEEEEKPGKVLYVANPVTGESLEVERISAHVVADHGNLVAGLTEKKEKDTLSVWEVVVVETGQPDIKLADSRRGEMKQLTIDTAGRQLVWMFSADTTDQKSFCRLPL
jgi:hypothetical protein